VDSFFLNSKKIVVLRDLFSIFDVSIIDSAMKKTDIHNVIMFQIEQTSKTAKQHTQKVFDSLGLGITVEQWILMKIVQETQPLSQKELAEFSLRDPASITRTLDILQKKGFLVREAIPGNRRQYNVRLTSSGEAFVQKHMALVKQQREQSTAGFSAEELNQLSEMLQRIKDNMS